MFVWYQVTADGPDIFAATMLRYGYESVTVVITPGAMNHWHTFMEQYLATLSLPRMQRKRIRRKRKKNYLC